MTKTFFIADIHLSTDYPEKNILFQSFLDMAMIEKGDIYILGDLFDFWTNNRRLSRNYFKIFSTLEKITASGFRVGFIFGNRDFLLKNKTLSSFGIDFLGEEAEITLDSKRVFLTHGHTLCALDIKFKKYKESAWPVFILLDKILPGFIENYIARKFILKSKSVICSQDQSKLQFSADIIKRYFSSGIDTVICGHAHRTENLVFGKNRFYALPCWENSRGWYLLYDRGDFALHEFI